MMDWMLSCPVCGRDLGWWKTICSPLPCPGCKRTFSRKEKVWRFLPEERKAFYEYFLADYSCIRRKEGRGSENPADYLNLPDAAPHDPLAWQWQIRAKSYRFLVRKIMPGMGRNLKILDLGAGVGWLSHRLAMEGHHSCAVDIHLDRHDGLLAAHHYHPAWPVIQAEFDALPLAADQADLIIFNGSFHYSTNYEQTLTSARRVLKDTGRIIIMDSPVYRHYQSGTRMVAERKADFEKKFGTASDALDSIEFLTWDMLKGFETTCGLRFTPYVPWYGLNWALRPVKARLKRKREPSRFALLVGKPV